jgi:hypothetical protein
MKKNLSFLFLMVLVMLFASNQLSAQKALDPKPSPMALVKANLDGAYVSVTYSQPHRKDRTIFGELVPFGKIWRFGANEATQFTTTGDIQIGDKTLKAGTYTVFCVPEKEQWTLIFNTVLGQWGSYQYDATKDVMKVTAKTEATSELWEPFTVKFEKPDGKKTSLVAMWENTMVSFPIMVK